MSEKVTKATSSDIESTTKLNTRIHANSAALHDFDMWCIDQMPETSLSANILDLGCGTGKQLHLFSHVLSSKVNFWGLDKSAESLEKLSLAYDAPPQLHTVAGSFDALDQEDLWNSHQGKFDLIYGVYAMYYTHDLAKVIRDVYTLLKPGGVFWVIGPDSGTNDEFLSILRPLHEVESFMDYVFDRFMPEVIAKSEATGFQSINTATLKNKVYFPSADAFLAYLSNSLFYRPGHDEAIRSAVQKVVDREGRFTVSKNVLSLQLRK